MRVIIKDTKAPPIGVIKTILHGQPCCVLYSLAEIYTMISLVASIEGKVNCRGRADASILSYEAK